MRRFVKEIRGGRRKWDEVSADLEKPKTVLSIGGDLSECVEKAKEKIRRLETESDYILRRFTEEEKRKNSHFAAIAVAKRFIEVVERQSIDKKTWGRGGRQK